MRTFETISESDLGETTILVDGEEQDNPHAGSMDIQMTTTETMVFVDEIHAVDDERATHFERTFRKLGQVRRMESSMMPEGKEGERISDLEETTVVFKWDDENEEYEKEFSVDEGLDDDLLEGLTEDLTLRGFLPEDEVSEGDSWEVDIEAYMHAMWPGGNLAFYEEEQGTDRVLREDGRRAARQRRRRDRGDLRRHSRRRRRARRRHPDPDRGRDPGRGRDRGRAHGRDRPGGQARAGGRGRDPLEPRAPAPAQLHGRGRRRRDNEMRAPIPTPDGEEREYVQRSVYEGETKYSFTLEEE